MKQRLLSLDVLRGITVAGMILVNNAGGEYSYDSLRHSAWNGLTPCDLVFPFFLFIMGISTYISLRKYEFRYSSEAAAKILKRTLLILLIGWALTWFHHACKGDFFPWETLRLTGVLPRIALCYGIVSLLALTIPHRKMPLLIFVLLALYTLLLLVGNGYVADESNLLCRIDRTLLGASHLYAKSPIDPEGLAGTVASVAHTLIGFLCGEIILRKQSMEQRLLRLFLVGFSMMAIGFLLTEWLPLNKRIWSPTYALVTCGLAAQLLASLACLIDIEGRKSWCRGFEVFGVNPLFLYVLAEAVAVIVSVTGFKVWVYEGLHTFLPNPYVASAAYSLLFVLAMGTCGYPLYKKKIYIKL